MSPNIFMKSHVSEDNWDKYTEQVLAKLNAVVLKTALDIKRLAQYYVPVDQGTAKASIYVVTPEFSDQIESLTLAAEAAKNEESRYGHKGRLVEMFEEPNEVQEMHALICVGVIYGFELEMEGNIRAKNPGASRPYLTPAFEQYHDTFIKACAACFSEIK